MYSKFHQIQILGKTMTISREESRRIVSLLHPGNRFRLMFGQPFLPGDEAGVEACNLAIKQYETNEVVSQNGQDLINKETTDERKL